MQKNNFCSGFSPSIDKNCTLLILGSMPGITSLEQQQYYAHPQNRFWPLLISLLGYPTVPEAYAARLSLLIQHHIALWDSIETCERSGSLDTAIINEKANDFNHLLCQYPKIKKICFNGNKSFQAFKKHNKELLKNTNITFISLPSTSPANARWHMDMLCEVWGNALKIPQNK
ncbi:MAG: DNA-deoxyinosine glycosylase [Selenomonadaceae bacterium]